VIEILLKSKDKPTKLVILEALKNRMSFSNLDQQNYFNQLKGYEGEIIFESLTDKLVCDSLVLSDLALKTNNQDFQIDSLLISKYEIHLLEVKNYRGDYYYESNKFLKSDRSEITNPLLQLQRTQSLLRQLLVKLNYTVPIHSSVIFVNPEFMLYQAPPDLPIIYPSQLNRFIKNLNADQSKLQETQRKLAKDLLSLHSFEDPYQNLPAYDYQQLRKGITCAACNSLNLNILHKKCICKLCGYVEDIDSATMRAVKEFKLLFPNEKVTTSKIYEWCDIITSKKRIQRILKNNFKLVDVLRWGYYE